jgi:plastocyanin
VALVLLAAACGEPRADRDPGPRVFDDVAPEVVATVELTEDGFEPEEVELDAGQAIELTNASDGEARAVARQDDLPDYDTGVMHAGDTVTLAFPSEGSYAFAADGAETRAASLEVVVRPGAASEEE